MLEAMRQRQLGSDGLVTSALGMGCMGLSQGYGPADDDESIRAIRRAAELGVTMFDTAMSYGQGHNERLIGRALAGLPWQVQVATKFGIVRDAAGVHLDGRPEHVRGYCEASLARLGVDVIDLYYLHRPDPQMPIADTIGAMAQLVTEGKVRHLGVSEVTPAQLGQAAAVHPISAIQFEWSLLWRDPEDDIIPAARRVGTGIVPYSPLGRGMLTATLTQADIDGSDFRRGDPRFHGGDLDQNLARVAALRSVADGLGLTAAQLALAWLLAQGPDVVPIPGTHRLDRIGQNVAAAGVELTEADLRGLEDAVPRAGWSGDRRSFAAAATSRRPGPAPAAPSRSTAEPGQHG
jgi:aryl-alcohol dehydrogenase-like predicted oxidoreductase